MSRTRCAGRASVGVLVGLIVLALVGAAVVFYALTRPVGVTAPPSAPMTQAQIDDELGALQKAFQDALQEGEGLARIGPKAKRFTEQHPDEPAGHVLLAQVRMGEQRWGQAYASMLQALELDPRAYELCKMAGFCAAKLGKLEQAQSHYSQAAAIAGSRTDSEVYTSLGRLYLAMEDASAAEGAYNQALGAPGVGERTNWKHEACSGLADVASVRGEYDKAHELSDRAIKFAKIDSGADLIGYHIQKARLYLDEKRNDDALAMLTHTWQQYPGSQLRIESARLRARLYEEAGELDKAVNHITYVCDTYQAGAARDNDTLAGYYALLAKWQIKAGQRDAAATSIHNLATLMPGHRELETLRRQLAIK